MSEGMVAANTITLCSRCVLQLLLLCTVGLFLVSLSAVSLTAWWDSHALDVLGKHLKFPYLSSFVSRHSDEAKKFFFVSLSEALALAVSLPLLAS